MKRNRHQNGFGVIAAIMVLVVLGMFAAAIVKFGTGQAMGSAQDVSSAQAWQSARAGLEWGLYRAVRPGQPWHTVAGCNAASATPVSFRVDGGMMVSVRCEARDYNEGEVLVAGSLQPRVVRHFVVTATACGSSTACPDASAAVKPGYVERMRQVSASCSIDPATGTC